MPVDPSECFAHGGKRCVDFLQFALVSARPDAMFVFLAREFGFRPTARGAVALFDQFLAPNALARVTATNAIPPMNPAFVATITPFRLALDRIAAFTPTEETPDPPPMPIPPGYLFDAVTASLRESVAATAVDFDPEKGPIGSLPGGRMTVGQRAWVENTWCKRVRPQLVAAGFWRVSSLGQP